VAALLDSQTEKIEETLWVSLRMFEERKNLLNNMHQKEVSPAEKTTPTLNALKKPPCILNASGRCCWPERIEVRVSLSREVQ
jgi:hypothetical protein